MIICTFHTCHLCEGLEAEAGGVAHGGAEVEEVARRQEVLQKLRAGEEGRERERERERRGERERKKGKKGSDESDERGREGGREREERKGERRE